MWSGSTFTNCNLASPLVCFVHIGTRQFLIDRRCVVLQEFKASDFGYYKTKVAQLLTVAREQKLAEAGPSVKPRTLKAEEKYAFHIFPEIMLCIVAAVAAA